MRRNLMIAALLALTVALLPGASAASADTTCNPGDVCAWSWWNFTEAKGESLCTGGVHYMAELKRSVKNRCANKAVWLRKHETNPEGCLEPGQQDPNTEFTDIWIGVEGSRC
jgi:hypothetical protein